MIQFKKYPGQKILELGGGANRHPQADCNVDVRPCQLPDGTQCVDFTASFEEPLPISSDEWDVVYCCFCIEHISWRKVRQFIAEIFRVLKPGGKAIVISPNTSAQIEWITTHPNGWDEKDDFDSFSCVLFGDNDYPENSHKSYWDPMIATRLFQEAGFAVNTKPFGDYETDMVIDGTKPKVDVPAGVPIVQEAPLPIPGPLPEEHPLPSPLEEVPAEDLFNCAYFNGGGKVGGYAREGIWDFPVHWITANHVLERRPTSVLELGCARGYILKRIQDVGIPANGLEVSKHCYLTRVCDGIYNTNLTKTWPLSEENLGWDLGFSMAMFEHIPEKHLPGILTQLKQRTKRGLHGIDFGSKDDGFDRTHFTLRPKRWWRELFDKYGLESHEIVDKESLEKGSMPEGVAGGDSKLKLNVGSFTTQWAHGWVNIDVQDLAVFAAHYGYRYLRQDARWGLPFGSSTVDCITSVHMLEHLSYQEGLAFLRECRRVLKPATGVMRIQVPDAKLLTGYYEHDKGIDDPKAWQLSQFDEVNEGCAQSLTPMGKLWSIAGVGHQAFYDAETLQSILREADLVPLPSSFREIPSGSDARLSREHLAGFEQIAKETLDTLPSLTLFVNCIAKIR